MAIKKYVRKCYTYIRVVGDMMKKLYFLLTVFLSCLFLLNTYADTGYVKSQVTMREKPSTASSVKKIMEIPKGTEFEIINQDTPSGNGCGNPWFYIYYNGEYGYVCSSLVGIVGELNTTYERPWNSPEKAIRGGALFISSGYIAKGQYTSYLKKFNVNPESYYPQFNHEYMYNLRAPSSEAVSTYNSLKANGKLDEAYDFVIPYFENMPDSTYDSSIKKIDLKRNDDIIDEEFEKTLDGFPDSYKPYLRYIHSIHSNWTFTPMKTNYDFNEGVTTENRISSIEISSGLCGEPYTVTEKGWCVSTREAVAFFLDPRNFLNETYIFMFENLGFKEIDESLIKGVLSGTFMDNIEPISNKLYSLLFLEAGRYAKVSALYLASLSRQEVGTKISNVTNGAEFTYEGYTYSGLYNFFSIGASSSESNPALAGLVFANGGKGKNNGGTVNPTPIPNPGQDDNTPEENVNFLELLSVSKTNGYITGYDVYTKVIDVINKIGGNANITVKNTNGDVLESSSFVGTGTIMELSKGNKNERFVYVLKGDTNGDGVINSADLLKLRQHLLETNVLSGAFKEACKLANNDTINSADLLKLRQYLLSH